MTPPSTDHHDAARTLCESAMQAWNKHQWASAARDWTKAAELIEAKIWNNTRCMTTAKEASAELRRSARAAITRRNAQERGALMPPATSQCG